MKIMKNLENSKAFLVKIVFYSSKLSDNFHHFFIQISKVLSKNKTVSKFYWFDINCFNKLVLYKIIFIKL